nr:upf0051 protein abci8, chloroplastic [Quercus suber]
MPRTGRPFPLLQALLEHSHHVQVCHTETYSIEHPSQVKNPTARIDQLFYFQQREIEFEKAMAAMISGFCRDVFYELPDERNAARMDESVLEYHQIRAKAEVYLLDFKTAQKDGRRIAAAVMRAPR